MNSDTDLQSRLIFNMKITTLQMCSYATNEDIIIPNSKSDKSEAI